MIDRPHPLAMGHTAWPFYLEPFHAMGSKIADFFSPSSEAARSEDNYEINMELPGVEESDLKISLDGNLLTVSGEKKSEHEESGKTYFFSERTYGAFKRDFRVPDDVDTSAIDAAFSKGVLTLTLPKMAAKKSPKQTIEVRSN